MSRGFSILAIMIALYLSTFDYNNIIFFPTILILSGLVLQLYTLRRVASAGQEDYRVSTDNMRGLLTWSLTGLAGLAVISAISPVFAAPKMDLTGVDAVLFSVLIAVAEEQFFRGFLTNFLGQSSPLVGSIGSSAVFTAYHLAVYRTETGSLFYVFAAGLLLAIIGYRSGKLSAPMLIHMFNNVLTFMR